MTSLVDRSISLAVTAYRSDIGRILLKAILVFVAVEIVKILLVSFLTWAIELIPVISSLSPLVERAVTYAFSLAAAAMEFVGAIGAAIKTIVSAIFGEGNLADLSGSLVDLFWASLKLAVDLVCTALLAAVIFYNMKVKVTT